MRHKHTLSWERKGTGDMGKIYPIGLREVLPGDKIQHSTQMLIRLGAMNFPVMHRCQARIHHFFEPSRVLLKKARDASLSGADFDWEDFITGGDDGLNADTIPTIATTGTPKDLLDHLALPVVSDCNVSVLPIVMYNDVFNLYYRDQDLVTERVLNDTSIASAAWEKDYFTTARPWSQKGAAISIPVGDTAKIAVNTTEGGGRIGIYSDQGSTYRDINSGGTDLQLDNTSLGNYPAEAMYADLSSATGIPVTDLRRYIGLQRMAEARAKYGNRLPEYIAAEFGVSLGDGRLQRPEYLGGGMNEITFSEVIQTAPETSQTTDSGVGELYGHGVAAVRTNAYRRSIPEHGYVMSFLSLRPRAVYQDGIDRMWLQSTREDFYQKQLEFIGQQEIYQNEIYADSAHTTSDIFGYNDRYRQYRESKNEVVGEFRDTLDYAHLARKFSSDPTLNGTFVTCNPSERIFAQSTNDNVYYAAYHSFVARRIVNKANSARLL